MKLPLTLAINPYDHARDLQPQGIDLTALELPIEEIFFRFTRFREWDVSEMSFGKVVSIMSTAAPDILCIPVFPSRVFRHSAIYIRKGSLLKEPKELEGKRVGVPEWAQTAGIYVRGMLQHEYGVDLRKISWFQAGVRQPGRIEKVELRLPDGITIKKVPDKSLVGMLAEGELDAVISARAVDGARLFEDPRRAELEYFRKTRIFPIMHVIALRRPIYERDRWIAMNLFKAFEEAKRRSVERLADVGLSHVPLPWIADHARDARQVMGEDFWPYGIEPNRATLEAFVQYAYEQGICSRQLTIEEMFAPETRESFKI